MKETELKLHPCYCGGAMEIKKVTQNGGMDGLYLNWELTCKKCGLTKTYAADGFYGRKYKTFEEVVDDWNRNLENKNKADTLDKIRAEIEQIETFAEDRLLFAEEESECKECADEHSQLAEWLKDYKRLLKQEQALDKAIAEIADLADCDAYGDVQQAFNKGLWRAVEIIDKYKAGGE